MTKITFLILLIFSTSAFAQNEWETANHNVIRLKPNDFLQLSKEIVSDLEKRDCTIPQSYFPKEKHNVIQGEFKKKGQKDWAVLCSKDLISSILVYWNGSFNDVSIIGAAEDKGFLQGVGKEKIGFSRVIAIADAKYIYDHYEAYGGIKPPEIEHQGINDIYAEKASVVLYLYREKWLELQGAD